MAEKKEFIFLYPIPEIFDFEIRNWGQSAEGGEEAFREKYSKLLNRSIDERYRKKGFGITYAVFNDCAVSDVIDLRPADRIIRVGLDFKTHVTQKIYPDQDHILEQLDGTQTLRIAGFHLWSCVERLARRANEKKIDVLVDEDLTEYFVIRFDHREFRTDRYPTYNARRIQGRWFDDFMRPRKERPWLWQNY